MPHSFPFIVNDFFLQDEIQEHHHGNPVLVDWVDHGNSGTLREHGDGDPVEPVVDIHSSLAVSDPAIFPEVVSQYGYSTVVGSGTNPGCSFPVLASLIGLVFLHSPGRLVRFPHG